VTLPTLYKRTATGAVQQWTIETGAPSGEASILTTHGQVGGAQQTTRDIIRSGKNKGRANETTPLEQAEAEALAKHTKKKEREGYVEDLARAQAGETDQEGGIAPMLAKPLEEVEKSLHFPMDAQAKHDGQRVIAVIEDGVCTLWSRKRKRLISLPHIVRAWEELLLSPRMAATEDR
jgi:DNA ligase-1